MKTHNKNTNTVITIDVAKTVVALTPLVALVLYGPAGLIAAAAALCHAL
jgi:hypothetical protein